MAKQFDWSIGFLLAWMVLATPAWAVDFRKLEPIAAPALVGSDLKGFQQNLAAYKGRVVLVNFWATWCPPCREEMPSLQRLAKGMAGKPFLILAVNSGDSSADVAAFFRAMPAGFPVLLDPDSGVTKRWKVFAMPTSFLIDKQGRVRYALPGGAEWDGGDALKHIQDLMSE
jgi:thiol-disulfide isomerase/thioredoxin